MLVGHPELKPMEFIWTLVESDEVRKSNTFKTTDIKKLVEEALANVTWENWRKPLLHIGKIEKASWEVNFGAEGSQQVDKVIDSLNSESSDRDDFFSLLINENLWYRRSHSKVFCKKCVLYSLKNLDVKKSHKSICVGVSIKF